MSYSSKSYKSYSSGSEPPSPESPPLSSSAASSCASLYAPRRRVRSYAHHSDSHASPPLKRALPALQDVRLLPPFLAALALLFLCARFAAPLAPSVSLDLSAPTALLPPGTAAAAASAAAAAATATGVAPAPPPGGRLSNKEVVAEVRRWTDPAYARERLKVFYYELPERFNKALVKDSHDKPPAIRDPYCDENFYSAEHTISEFFRTGPVRTMNASEADYFYVPIFATCYLVTHLPNDAEKTGAFFGEAMDYVMNEYPYWNRSDGRDHVFMFAQGFGARLAGDWTRYRHATFLVHNGDYEEEHFDTHKDIVVPPDLSHYLTPVGLSHPGQLLRKSNFVLFGGQVVSTSISDHRGSNYSGGVRQFIQSELSGLEGYKVTGVRSTTYVDDMLRSVFCLAPHGWHKWSPRPAYAVLLGCIPVVISEQQEVFLGHLIDYAQISYWTRPADMRALDAKLRAIGHEELTRREVAMRDVWALFWYGDRGLGEQAIAYSLHRRLQSAQPVRSYM